MKKFLWAASHEITAEQHDSLVAITRGDSKVVFLKDVDAELQNKISNLQFEDDVFSTAKELLKLCKKHGFTLVQPAGSPAMHYALGVQNTEGADAHWDSSLSVPILYAFSKRESVDLPQPDGSIRKVAVFRHEGWKWA